MALEEDCMTKDEIDDKTRQALTAVHSPKLDTLRAALPEMRTSTLIGLLTNADILVDRLDEDGPYDPKAGPQYKYTEEQQTLIATAAVLAIGDEIDRRIPA
jgi:hypothetical protein